MYAVVEDAMHEEVTAAVGQLQDSVRHAGGNAGGTDAGSMRGEVGGRIRCRLEKEKHLQRQNLLTQEQALTEKI